jgi:hypothetical protein
MTEDDYLARDALGLADLIARGRCRLGGFRRG